MPRGDLPNARERAALQKLQSCQWEYDAKLYPAGPGTIASMIRRGWVERLHDMPFGSKRCRITLTGEAALRSPIIVGLKAKGENCK